MQLEAKIHVIVHFNQINFTEATDTNDLQDYLSDTPKALTMDFNEAILRLEALRRQEVKYETEMRTNSDCVRSIDSY